MTDAKRVVIVGGGLAAAKTAEALRTRGFDRPITVFGQEGHRPYERPPLSKANLSLGTVAEDELFVHDPGWYDDNDVDLRTGRPVLGLDLPAHQITVGAGERTRTVPFDLLVLATGASPRKLPVPGSGLPGVHYLRTLEDSNALHAVLATGPRLVVIGGGWIGLEVAAAASTMGATVTVLEAGPMPMAPLLGERVAAVLLDAHRSHGVEVRTQAHVVALVNDGRGHVSGVELADGTHLEADAVVVGIGALPNTALAEQAGLKVANGVVVDPHLQTSHPDVFAVGDIANAWHPTLGRRLRVEHWANALNQPQTVAAAITGQGEHYDALPYFFSDQYDLGLEYVGHPDPVLPCEVVIRGDETSGKFTAFWLQEGKVAAGLSVNSWGQTKDVEALIRGGVHPPLALLTDTDVPLDDLRLLR
ncbi:NAD(P)/FAD-dependent oxidoreductase [Pedococcus soli]